MIPDVLADAGRVRRERMLAIAHPDHPHALEDAIDITGVTA